MSRREDEDSVYRAALVGLQRWLGKARDAVMKPWFQYKAMPDPVAIFETQSAWDSEVDTILTVLGRISLHAWSLATDVPPVSRHAFMMAHLADTKSLLVRVPEEVYHQIFAAITDAVNAGGSIEDVARVVEGVLSWTGSENWTNRAKVIAQTETTRARGAATVAAGLEQSRVTGKRLDKVWDSHHDGRTRADHLAANGQQVPVYAPFSVGGEMLMAPGDINGSAGNVIGCRCDVVIVDGGR